MMLNKEYVMGMSDRDFMAVYTSVQALAIATAGDRDAMKVSEFRFWLGKEAERRNIFPKEITATYRLASDLYRLAHSIL